MHMSKTVGGLVSKKGACGLPMVPVVIRFLHRQLLIENALHKKHIHGLDLARHNLNLDCNLRVQEEQGAGGLWSREQGAGSRGAGSRELYYLELYLTVPLGKILMT